MFTSNLFSSWSLFGGPWKSLKCTVKVSPVWSWRCVQQLFWNSVRNTTFIMWLLICEVTHNALLLSWGFSSINVTSWGSLRPCRTFSEAGRRTVKLFWSHMIFVNLELSFWAIQGLSRFKVQFQELSRFFKVLMVVIEFSKTCGHERVNVTLKPTSLHFSSGPWKSLKSPCTEH